MYSHTTQIAAESTIPDGILIHQYIHILIHIHTHTHTLLYQIVAESAVPDG
jgi:hypothetical protein